MKIEYTAQRGTLHREIILPSSGYYFVTVPTGETVGLLFTLTGQRNNLKQSQLERDLQSAAEAANYFASSSLAFTWNSLIQTY